VTGNRWTANASLNGICPYFTMFPLDFPLKILKRRAKKNDRVLDPFCGRGTTGFAARLVGLSSMSVDSSPVAAAITGAKLVHVSAEEIMLEAHAILSNYKPSYLPSGEFWELAYHPTVLDGLCRFRHAFMEDSSSDVRIALRGIILGALHGPKQKTFPSYFSNQCPRTYAPKPGYSCRFWRERNLLPDIVDIIEIIRRRANRYYSDSQKSAGQVRLADSRNQSALLPAEPDSPFKWIITSPPYYGMRTYLPDQWLRRWLLGGSDTVDYSVDNQIIHSSPESFANDLRTVWQNAARVSTDDARMVIRFGGIADRKAKPLDLIKSSLDSSGWVIKAVRPAGLATEGKRQANTFLRSKSNPVCEYDIWTAHR